MENLSHSLAAYLSSDPRLVEKINKLIRFSPKENKDFDIFIPPLEVLKKCHDSEEGFADHIEHLLRANGENLDILNSSISEKWKFSKLSILKEKILLKLDRGFVMQQFLPTLLNNGHQFEAPLIGKRVMVVNCELSPNNHSRIYSQLAEVRCNQVCEFLRRIYKLNGHEIVSDLMSDESDIGPNFRIHVGCADPKLLNSDAKQADSVLKIGPILDAQTKKKDFSRSVAEIFSTLSQNFHDISIERANVRTSDIQKLAAAELQFQLLSQNPGQPICLTTDCHSPKSSFVQYNFARMCQGPILSNFFVTTDSAINYDFTNLHHLAGENFSNKICGAVS